MSVNTTENIISIYWVFSLVEFDVVMKVRDTSFFLMMTVKLFPST